MTLIAKQNTETVICECRIFPLVKTILSNRIIYTSAKTSSVNIVCIEYLFNISNLPILHFLGSIAGAAGTGQP